MAELRAKAAVIRRLCRITAKIGVARGHEVATDCFCADDNKDQRWQFRFDESVLDYIEESVDIALKVDKLLGRKS